MAIVSNNITLLMKNSLPEQQFLPHFEQGDVVEMLYTNEKTFTEYNYN